MLIYKEDGQKILNEAEKLYNYATTGTDDYRIATVTLTKSGNTYTSGDKLVQKFILTANKAIKSYDVILNGFPSGTTSYKNGNEILVSIPKDNINSNINGLIKVNNSQVKTCPAFYRRKSQ